MSDDFDDRHPTLGGPFLCGKCGFLGQTENDIRTHSCRVHSALERAEQAEERLDELRRQILQIADRCEASSEGDEVGEVVRICILVAEDIRRLARKES